MDAEAELEVVLKAERSGPKRRQSAADQRRHREGEHDRGADITEVKERRVYREARILKQRIEVLAFEGCRKPSHEGVGGEQDEAEEGKRRSSLGPLAYWRAIPLPCRARESPLPLRRPRGSKPRAA